ncbi:MAG: ECF-type sigma factor [Planctomycetota bacterium]
MNDVTQILKRIGDRDPNAAEELLPLVYDELRELATARVANERPSETLQATALVHDAYLRLVDVEKVQDWDSRGHFFAAAAEAMRRILINRARDRKRLKRGGDRVRLDLSNVSLAVDTPDELLIEIDEALERLAERDPDAAKLVRLKFFAGMSLRDAASSMGLTRRQGDRLWAYARAWLFDELKTDRSAPN